MKQDTITTGRNDPVDHPAFSLPGAGSRVHDTREDAPSRPTGPVLDPVKKSGGGMRIAGMLTALALGLGVTTFTLITGDESLEPTVASDVFSREDYLLDLVNRGLVPAQAVAPANPSREDVMRDFVNRGLVPRQALDPVAGSHDGVIPDSKNRDLILE